MRYFGATIFGLLALVSTLIAGLAFPMFYFVPLPLLATVPLWLLFFLYLLRAARR